MNIFVKWLSINIRRNANSFNINFFIKGVASNNILGNSLINLNISTELSTWESKIKLPKLSRWPTILSSFIIDIIRFQSWLLTK